MGTAILNVYGLLDDLETSFSPVADYNRLRLLVQRSSRVPQYVRADGVRLRQILTCLLSNALESASAGCVMLRADLETHPASAESGWRLTFAIEDTIESHEDHATEVILVVPVNPVDVSADVAGADQAARTVLALAPGQPRYRVLIADERRQARLLLIRLLGAIGFDVREASTGQEAQEVWQVWQPQAILMDLGMLAVEGREATQRIKADSKGHRTTIIALTASSFKETGAGVREAGIDDFLRKPFSEEALFEMLRKHLGVRYVYADEAASPTDVSSLLIEDAATFGTPRPGGQAKATILVVDDNPATLEPLAHLLTDQGYVVHAFLDGKLALSFVESTLPDLVMLDVLMPEMDGYQLCQNLKGRERTRDIPIIFLTIATETCDKVRGFRLGAVDYITRPFQPEEVLARVATHLALRALQIQLEAQNGKLQQAVALRERSERALQEGQAQLEQRVAERTSELAKVNANLQAEIAKRAQIEEALRRRQQESETLREVASVISASTDRAAVLGLILDELNRVVPYDSASLMLASGTTLDLVAGRGLQCERALPDRVPLATMPHLSEVLRQRQPVIIRDTTDDPRWRASSRSSQIHCWLGVPLVLHDKVIGLLNLDKVQPGFYMERDADLALAFANHAVIALENARLFDEISRRAHTLEVLVDISTALRQAQLREGMPQFVIEKSAEALHVDAGALLLLEGNALVLKAEFGRTTGLLEQRHPVQQCPHWHVVQTGEPLSTSDEAGQDEAHHGCNICRALMLSQASGILVPLKTAEATIGVLHLVCRAHRDFSADEKRLLVTIAEIAGGALHRAGILETLEQRVADRTRELVALYEVSAVSSQALDLQTMLVRSLERVLKAMRSSAATIHLLDQVGENLSLAAYQALAPSDLAEADLATPAPHVKDWLIKRGEPLVISDMTDETQTTGAAHAGQSLTYAGVPMRAGGRVLGMLGVVRDVSQQFSVEEVALLASIADQVAVAIENSRLHQRAEQMAVVEERARLARELHDSVTQCLSSVILLAQAASDFGAAADWGRVNHYLERIRDTGRRALKEMRLLLYELQPTSAEQVGLIEMLTHRIDAVECRAGVAVRLLTEDWPALSAQAEEALYRIALEALNNALKHSGAAQVTISLGGGTEGATLEVHDNGIGFDRAAAARKGGMGLLTMQQRALQLGGQLTIKSAPGEGTSVIVTLRTQ